MWGNGFLDRDRQARVRNSDIYRSNTNQRKIVCNIARYRECKESSGLQSIALVANYRNKTTALNDLRQPCVRAAHCKQSLSLQTIRHTLGLALSIAAVSTAHELACSPRLPITVEAVLAASRSM
jgi:hypothetical protein